jgi:hypothetical protein
VNEGKGDRVTVVMATILLALRFIWRLTPSDEAPRLAEEEFWRMKKETGLPKPWQKEALRLEIEIGVLSRVYGTSVLL